MIVSFLHEHHVAGLTNKELAKLVGTSEANICRDMAVFEKYQWVNRNKNARWRLSPTFAGIAGRIMRSYQTAKLLLSEEEAKYASAMQ
jgi:DNA-binding IclR family transcriptional regulator